MHLAFFGDRWIIPWTIRGLFAKTIRWPDSSPIRGLSHTYNIYIYVYSVYCLYIYIYVLYIIWYITRYIYMYIKMGHDFGYTQLLSKMILQWLGKGSIWKSQNWMDGKTAGILKMWTRFMGYPWNLDLKKWIFLIGWMEKWDFLQNISEIYPMGTSYWTSSYDV